MLDICSGLGGASAAMKERGWQVITLDNNQAFNPDICTDVRTWHYSGAQLDLIWCSPPCNEFSREFFVWCRTGVQPDVSIVQACSRIIKEIKPRYWVLENTRGGSFWINPILGRPSLIRYPYYLWGSFPDISHIRVTSHKEKSPPNKSAERGLIPYRLSLALAQAIEMQPELEMEQKP